MKKLLTLFLVMAASISAEIDTAVLAGGCFWCVQSDFDHLEGVVSTKAGFCGGHKPDPTYELVSSGATHYVESVEIRYDSQKLSYAQLLDYYWRHIDPTQGDGQFCDIGEQYRPVIFYLNNQQKEIAEKSKEELQKSGQFTHVAVEILPATRFYPAEAYHQSYYKKHPYKYKYYRLRCGRDAQVKRVWGKS